MINFEVGRFLIICIFCIYIYRKRLNWISLLRGTNVHLNTSPTILFERISTF